MSASPDHYCKAPFLDGLNFTESQIKNIRYRNLCDFIPYHKGTWGFGFFDYTHLNIIGKWKYFLKLWGDCLHDVFVLLISIPLETRDGKVGWSQCQMYDLESTGIIMNGSDVLIQIYDLLRFSRTNTSSLPIIPCKYGWVYDHSTYVSTIVTEVWFWWSNPLITWPYQYLLMNFKQCQT